MGALSRFGHICASRRETNVPIGPMNYWSGEPRFRGVIAMVGVKYTLFLPDGTPVRATVNLEMKQAGRLSSKGEAKEANKSAAKKQPDCSSSQQ